MAKAKVQKRKFRGKESDTYYFSPTINGKRSWVNTNLTNKKKSEKFRDDWYLEKSIEIKEAEEKIPEYETFYEYLSRDGESWLIPEQNPKYNLFHNSKKKSYGFKQAKEVASYLDRVFSPDKKNDELGTLPYNNLKKVDALLFRGRLSTFEDFTPRVKNEVLKALSAIFTFLLETDDSVEVNHFLRLPRFSEDVGERSGFSKTQAKKYFNNSFVLDYYEDYFTDNEVKERKVKDYLNTPAYRMFKFALLTGMRIGEIRAMTYGQLYGQRSLKINRAFKDATSRIESIKKPKWGKERTIVLCDTALDLIDYHVYQDDYDEVENRITNPHDENKFIFANKNGEPFSYTYCMKQWRFFRKFLKMSKKYTIHSLRHTFAGVMRNEGVPEFLIAQHCGWSNPNESRIQAQYTKTVPTSSTGDETWSAYKMAMRVDMVFCDRKMEEPKGSKGWKHLKPHPNKIQLQLL